MLEKILNLGMTLKRRSPKMFHLLRLAYHNGLYLRFGYGYGKVPFSVMVEPTNACNFSCVMCPHKLMKRPKGFIELDLFKLILKKCEEEGVSHLLLYTVGEPLLHPKFLEMLRLSALCTGIKKIEFFTNGSLLNEEYIREIVKINKCTAHISFSGWNKETYESRYKGGVFEEIIEKIRIFNQVIRESNMSGSSFKVNCLEDQRYGRESTRNFLRHNLGLKNSQIDINIPVDWVGSVSDKQNCQNRKADTKSKKTRYWCKIASSTIGILHDGRVTACGCLDMDCDMFIGDIKRQSIKEMRKGAQFKSILDRFNLGRLEGMICEDCNFKMTPYISARPRLPGIYSDLFLTENYRR